MKILTTSISSDVMFVELTLHMPQTSVEKYFEILDTQKDVHIFLATDQTQYVDLFKNKYGNEQFLHTIVYEVIMMCLHLN